MPPRRGRGRTTRRTEEECRAGSDDDVHQVEDVTRQIGGMELVLARFQRTNPPMFSAAEGGAICSNYWMHLSACSGCVAIFLLSSGVVAAAAIEPPEISTSRETVQEEGGYEFLWFWQRF
ncbi:hypothetical protein F511_30559 [Dorcoceras hygrometricum]|uniref:Uncharacterized protein n=1 Tax=Dorcoceras hygrometricum TaxID=472368 RepID=A0A2Z7BTJ0_9LAMI|nr:hypothetical protein F511_30559 [Dorcoceras hygrometricum]